MGQLEKFHREMREFDAEWSKCPVAKRQRELREEREREARKAREAREQQRQAATISDSWWAAIDQRIYQYIVQCFSEGEAGWLREVIGQALGAIQGKLRKEINELRGELNAAKTQLHERIARLPTVKTWDADEISYCGDVVTHDGNLYQARKNTGKEPPRRDWILLARAGRDGLDGRTPKLRGVFEAYQQYRQFDIVTCDGNCYIACRDDPGLPGHDDDAWQLLAKGSRGPIGDTGARGQRGARGPRGEDAPTIINWTLDRKRYCAVPTMSNGTQGAVLELRGLFEQFHEEVAL